MARVTGDELRAMVQPHMPQGEAVLHAAYGVKQPNMLLLVGLIALAVVPGLIAVHFMTKHYVLALGERSLLVLQVKPAFWKLRLEPKSVKSVRVVPLAKLRGMGGRTRAGGLFTHIAFGEKPDAFRAKFHRAFSKENRAEAMAIGAAVAAAG